MCKVWTKPLSLLSFSWNITPNPTKVKVGEKDLDARSKGPRIKGRLKSHRMVKGMIEVRPILLNQKYQVLFTMVPIG
uniref:Uncharacterized protein n=1 Tax=Rhizophora mucronata TaxID=61149 RepID=A0A2P2Q2V6_RHIMU